MTESNGQQDLSLWEPRELLGDPRLDAYDAYREAIDDAPLLSAVEQRNLARLVKAKQWAESVLADESIELSADDKIALEKEVIWGDRAIRTLVARHLPQILGLARKFAYSKDSALELASIGNLELVEAAPNYKVVEGASFAAFAATVARNAMSAYVVREKQRLTGITRSMREMLSDIREAHEAALAAGDEIGFLEIADFLGYDTKAAAEALRLKETETISLDATLIVNGTLTTYADVLVDEGAALEVEAVADKILLEKVWEAARTLKQKDLMSEREWQIFVMRFRDGMSQSAIAEVVGIAQTGISDYEEKVIAMLKRAVEDPDSLVLPRVGAPSEVKKPVHLLALLGVPVRTADEAMAGATELINNAPMTKRQHWVISRLLGTDGEAPSTLTELSRELGVSVRAVCISRDRAVAHVVALHQQRRAACD